MTDFSRVKNNKKNTNSDTNCVNKNRDYLGDLI